MEIKPKKCACGRDIPRRWNSTIQNKECNICRNNNLLAKSTMYKKSNTAKKSKKSSGKRKRSDQSLAMERADKWFSRYIRIKYSYKIQDGDVFCQCIVDRSVIKHAKHMDNGHFKSRGFQATRYWENNCRPQNRSSNRWKGEEHNPIFGDNLSAEIGKEAFEEIELMYRQITMVSAEYFNEIADKYRYLVNNLVKEHNITKWW